jgi:glucosamine-phosphate N-acetyltransferase
MRKLTRHDYAAYLPLIREFRDTTFTEEEFRVYMDSLPHTMEIWVMEEGNTLIATATIIFEPKLIFNRCTYAHIEDVCVTQRLRGKGFGTVLMDRIVDICKARDCKKVTLVCNEPLHGFYEKSGFGRRGIQMSILLKE